jgi:saccharopine dehydrogenase-like NADP-dependent oxidoreductase
MKVLVVGAGRTGARVIRQLRKNPDIEIVTADPRADSFAVEKGVIEAVDILEGFTPLTVDYVLEKANPDLILLATATEDLGLGAAPGIDILAEALRKEMASASDVPLIEVARYGE